tara:strand:+ start:276 stop:740 length:465 start_codon:yes stop_codon:yes gene_type:complete
MGKKSKKKKYYGTQLGMEYVKGTVKNLMLDKPIKALPSTHNRVDGKDVPVNKQIADYLKSMEMLEKSTSDLEDSIEKSEKKIEEIRLLFESKIIKKRYRGKTYSSTPEMIRAVKLEAQGKISYKNLKEMISWHEDPEGLIEVSRMIAGIGRFRR